MGEQSERRPRLHVFWRSPLPALGVGVAVVLTLIVLIATCSPASDATPESTRTTDIALLDRLIECSGEGVWDRTRLIENLDTDRDRFIQLWQEFVDICESPAWEETPTLESVPVAGYSQASLDLLANYYELLRFKDEVWFHIYCYALISPAHEWSNRIAELNDNATLGETGILSGELWSMGLEFCHNEGRETEGVRAMKSNIKATWLDYRPIPTPRPEMQVMADRPYQSLSEMVASCLWSNQAMYDYLPEAYDLSNSEAEMAVALEDALEDAVSKTTYDGLTALWTLCKQ